MPAVVGIAPPLDQPAFFQVVDEQHESAGRRPQLSREFLLALPWPGRDQPKEARLGRGEVEVGDPLGEPRRRVRPDLGQQQRVQRVEHAYHPVLLPLVLSFGLAAGWVRHRTGTVGATIPMQIAVDLSLFLAAVALA